jgi:hypothetical protein
MQAASQLLAHSGVSPFGRAGTEVLYILTLVILIELNQI